MLKDESSKRVDPVSGNEIPVGATAEEVRDDVDAKLSVGEFVLPADVVRYIGLNNIMKLRDAAKAGLARMEAQGQMGNGDEQEVEGHNIDMDEMIEAVAGEKEEEDETEMAFSEGGVVPSFAAGGVMQSRQYTPVMQYTTPEIPTVAAAPSGGVAPVQAVQPVQAASAQYVRPTVGDTSAMQSSQYTPVLVPSQVEGVPSTVAPAPTGAPTPEGLPTDYVPPPDFAIPPDLLNPDEITEVIYIGPNGDEIVIRFNGTVPLDSIPAGYVRKDSIEPAIENPEIDQPEIDAPVVDNTRATSDSSSSEPSGDTGPKTISQRKTDTGIALAQLLAKDNPEIQEVVDRYVKDFDALDFHDKSLPEMIGEIFSRVGLFGIIKTVGQAVSLNRSKDAVAEAIKDANVGVPADLLRQWSTSQRKPQEIIDIAKAAQFAGASQNLALAMAIDDRFDVDSLQGLGESDLSEWEQTVADMYQVNKGSSQAITIAKEDLDLFDGDIAAYREWMGETDPSGLSEASKAQIAERDAIQEQMDALGLGDIGSMSAADAEKKIADEKDRLEAVRIAEEKRIAAEKAEAARIAAEKAEAAQKALAAKQKELERQMKANFGGSDSSPSDSVSAGRTSSSDISYSSSRDYSSTTGYDFNKD